MTDRRREIFGFAMFVVALSLMAYTTTYESPELRAVNAYLGVKRPNWAILYLMVFGMIFLGFIFIFKIRSRRIQLISWLMLFVYFVGTQFPFKYSTPTTLATMALIILIGWLYPSRKEKQTQI
jgi:hypothetical protein